MYGPLFQVKLDRTSKVVHFRGVPSDASEAEIVQLGLPFGHMTNLVLAKMKNQVGAAAAAAAAAASSTGKIPLI